MTPPHSTSPAIWPNGASNPAAALPAQMALCNRISCPSRWRQKRLCSRIARHPSRRRPPPAAAADLAAAPAEGKGEERGAEKAAAQAQRPPRSGERRVGEEG